MRAQSGLCFSYYNQRQKTDAQEQGAECRSMTNRLVLHKEAVIKIHSCAQEHEKGQKHSHKFIFILQDCVLIAGIYESERDAGKIKGITYLLFYSLQEFTKLFYPKYERLFVIKYRKNLNKLYRDPLKRALRNR